MKIIHVAAVAIASTAALSSCSTPSRTAPQSTAALVSNLTAASVTFEPNPARVGDKMTFHQKVLNEGTETIKGRTYDVDFLIDGEPVCFDHDTRDLPAGQSAKYRRIDWQPTQARRYHYKLEVSARDRSGLKTELISVLAGHFDVQP